EPRGIRWPNDATSPERWPALDIRAAMLSAFGPSKTGVHCMKLIRAALVALLSANCFAFAAAAETVVVHAGKMLDVEHGQYLPDRAIRIEDGRIVSVTPWSGTARGARLIDWSAFTVLPGLIDLHTHLVGDISSADVNAPLSSSAAR